MAMSRSSKFRANRALDNWERLVRAAEAADFPDSLHVGPSLLRHESSSISGYVPPSLEQTSNIDAILQVANDIQRENPNVARILCEHAYSLSQSMDPNSEGRGVLQFKTGLMTIIKQKLAKKDGETIDQTQDIAQIQLFYNDYRTKSKIDELQEQAGIDPEESERRYLRLRKVYATLTVLRDVMNALVGKASSSSEEVDQRIPEKMKEVMESDAAKMEEFKAFNILQLDACGKPDAFLFSEEIKAAVNELDAVKALDSNLQLPDDFEVSRHRETDIFDILQYIFGFQDDNTNNQREHLVLLLANAQSRLVVPQGTDLQLDENAVNNVCEKMLDNYNNWCEYLLEKSEYSSSDRKQNKLLLVSLYLLIWGEAANVRFLPECICYIFHKMAKELLPLRSNPISSNICRAASCKNENKSSFLNKIILPVYVALAAEAAKNGNGKQPHSSWCNYDDFNEFFWSRSCFALGWPWQVGSLFSSESKVEVGKKSASQNKLGKNSFVEHRTFFHLYHSFHRLWIILVLAFQALAVIAFSRTLDLNTVKGLLSLGPTFVVMKFFESIFDVMLMIGAYKHAQGTAVARIFIRFLWFGACSGFLTYLYFLVVREHSQNLSSSLLFKGYAGLVAIFFLFQFCIALLLRVPLFRVQMHKCDHWSIIRFLKWMHQEQYYVGRRLYEKTQDYLKYLLFWLVVLGCKFAFSYFVQIKPLVKPTRTIAGYTNLTYSWHDFVSKGNHNALTIASVWAPVVLIYLLDISIWYTVFSSIVGVLIGTRERLGEIRSLEVLRNRFGSYPHEFVAKLTMLGRVQGADKASVPKANATAASFAPFWNEIIICLREEDYLNNREKELLIMPSNKWSLTSVQWPLFLLVSKVFRAVDLAAQYHNNQKELWDRVTRDDYMLLAVEEVYMSLVKIFRDVSNDEAKDWVVSVADDVKHSIEKFSFTNDFHLRKLQLLLSRILAILVLLRQDRSDDREGGAVKAMLDFYDVVTHDLMSSDMRKRYESWEPLAKAKKEKQLFSKLNWPSSQEDRSQIERVYRLLTMKESAATVPTNLEARRRLQFFVNSLFMTMPDPKFVRSMRPFSVFTPYYSEDVIYSNEQLQKPNEDGISILFYLKKIFPDEWRFFLERIGCKDEKMLEEGPLQPGMLLELRLWASYRGQTLARTVRGMMYYRRALMLQTFLEQKISGGDLDVVGVISSEGYQKSFAARAQADLKFTYVMTCQIYGQQKRKQDPRAADILFLMQQNEGLRVAFIDIVETMKDGKIHKEFFSKLVKAGINGKDQEIYKIKLPGDPKLGEGKPENQNHAIVFTRGDAVQTIDMNQDNYFEEALKMRNLLEEFGGNHGLRPPSILGVREHVFTGSVSSLAWFMSNQEMSFVTLGQRVLATPLKVRMHYGHPDVFDRVFHITRGGISKASRVINISEDIFAGFNSTLRQGNITHHEYIQVGKGRDVGLNQIAMFEGKVAGGNGEQSLSRDVYRLGQLFDFFRMLSFYVTSVGYYACTMMTVLTVYVFLYGKAYLVFSGIGSDLEDQADLTNNTALQSALSTQFLLQIGLFTAIPMVMGFILEQGVLRAVINFVTMQLQLCSVFFTFSLGTRTHYFGRTILHGGAKYRATGRGFVVQHIKFAENYRLYSRSHFVKALEIVILLLVYLVYGFEKTTMGFILLSFSSWFLAISWLFAPYIFNPAGFEWQKTVEDFSNWTNWLLYKGGVGVKGEESWETWWDEEQEHIYSLRGKILETILSLRFFFFQYGMVYKLNVANSNTSLSIYGFSWLVLGAIVLLFKVFTFSQKASVNFQMLLRLIQGTVFVLVIVCLALLVILTSVSVGDLFASLLALLPTGWAILCIAIAWKPLVKALGLWKSVRAVARFYDAAMGLLVFIPIAVLSWFPFVSTFQTRLVFNQAFSRGLEISLILAGNQPNSQV